jgi:hypothetical protein
MSSWLSDAEPAAEKAADTRPIIKRIPTMIGKYPPVAIIGNSSSLLDGF